MPAIAGLLVGAATARPGPDPPPPVSVFAALDGTWSGTFVSYDTAGRELARLTARHTYRTVSDTDQRVEIEDRLADGTIVTARGTNRAERAADGTLRLRCLLTKSNGERIDHAGRLVRGPDGEEQIIWYTDEPGRVETFREVVRHEQGEWFYEINGMGRYGNRLILMAGRYRKVADPDPEKDTGSRR